MAAVAVVCLEGYGSYRRAMSSEAFCSRQKKPCEFERQDGSGNCTITDPMICNGSFTSKNMVNGMPSVLKELQRLEKQSRHVGVASGQGVLQQKRKRGGLKCFACGDYGLGVQLSHHLLFGEVECRRCKVKFASCRSFRESNEAPKNSTKDSTCKHLFQFCNPFDYLHDRISIAICRRNVEKLSTSRVFRKLSHYLDKMKLLCDRDPWRSAVRECVSVLKEMRAQRVGHIVDSDDICIEYAPVSPEEQDLESQVRTGNEELVAARPDEDGEVGDILLAESFNINQLEEIIEYHVAEDVPTTFVKVEYEDDLDPSPQKLDVGQVVEEKPTEDPLAAISLQMPNNGYYLVTKQAIEECPMCYTELCPSKFTINVKTLISTTVCSGCNLVIYIPLHGPHLDFP